MAYNFLNAFVTATATPPSVYKKDLQAFIDSDFATSTSYYEIEEETAMGSNKYQNVGIRINHALVPGTGINLGDDWRNFVFQDIEHARGLGFRYRFSDYYWITINSDNYKFVTASSLVRRCNHTLKWRDDFRNLVEEPCIVDYFKFASTNLVKENIQALTGNAYRFIVLQANDNTLKLKRNQRFILEGRAWRIYDVDTITKRGLVQIALNEHQINPTVDELNNNVADEHIGSVFTMQLLTTDLALNSGQSKPIEVVVYKDGAVYIANLKYVASTPCFSVDGFGNVVGIANGNGTVKVSLFENENIFVLVNVSISASPIDNFSEEIVGEDFIPIGQNSAYEIYNLINGEDTGDTYTFSVSNSKFLILSYFSNGITLKAPKIIGESCILTATNDVSLNTKTKTINTETLW